MPGSTARTLRIKAGGNSAEWTFGAIKRNISRQNFQRATTTASLNLLSSAWLQKHPGLAGVARGIRVYMDAVVGKVSPQEAFKSTEWLTTQEKVE